jgi:hypothetical protein
LRLRTGGSPAAWAEIPAVEVAVAVGVVVVEVAAGAGAVEADLVVEGVAVGRVCVLVVVSLVAAGVDGSTLAARAGGDVLASEDVVVVDAVLVDLVEVVAVEVVAVEMVAVEVVAVEMVVGAGASSATAAGATTTLAVTTAMATSARPTCFQALTFCPSATLVPRASWSLRTAGQSGSPPAVRLQRR